MNIKIYTDGACSGNPGIGGWGAIIIINDKKEIKLNGGSLKTTNNQMELTATINALKYFTSSENIILYTDSQYVKNGINIWIKNWKTNNWKTTSKKPVKNKILWQLLDEQIFKHKINWNWVKGHSGNERNEQADILAKKFILENKL
tara:strand:- start:17800 stop:18237 length:438 start_codon:yes stop_codon:yes gene_type:complete